MVPLSAVSVTHGQLRSENSSNKQFVSFQLQTILSRVKKSHAIPLSPPQDVNHPSVQFLHVEYIAHPLTT